MSRTNEARDLDCIVHGVVDLGVDGKAANMIWFGRVRWNVGVKLIRPLNKPTSKQAVLVSPCAALAWTFPEKT